MRAHVVEMGFYREKQVRVLHWNAEQMDLPIDTIQLGFERRHLCGGSVLIQSCFNRRSRRYMEPNRYCTSDLNSFGAKLKTRKSKNFARQQRGE